MLSISDSRVKPVLFHWIGLTRYRLLEMNFDILDALLHLRWHKRRRILCRMMCEYPMPTVLQVFVQLL